MPMSPLTAEKLSAVLEDLTAGSTIKEACRRRRLSPQTFYRWGHRVIGETMQPLERLHDVEEENRRLKRTFAELSLDYNILRAALINQPFGEC
jgi:putative transposase